MHPASCPEGPCLGTGVGRVWTLWLARVTRPFLRQRCCQIPRRSGCLLLPTATTMVSPGPCAPLRQGQGTRAGWGWGGFFLLPRVGRTVGGGAFPEAEPGWTPAPPCLAHPGEEYQPLLFYQETTAQILVWALNPLDYRKWRSKSAHWRVLKVLKVGGDPGPGLLAPPTLL